jgi:hypothetical protein
LKRADIYSGGLLFLFGLFTIYVIVPVQIDSGGDYGLDPSFFPVTTLWLVVIMAIVLIGHRLLIVKDFDSSSAPLDGMNWLFIGCAALLLAITYYGMITIGFIATSLILIAVLMIAIGARRQNWLALVITPIVAPLVIYFALGKIFIVQLP